MDRLPKGRASRKACIRINKVIRNFGHLARNLDNTVEEILLSIVVD